MKPTFEERLQDQVEKRRERQRIANRELHPNDPNYDPELEDETEEGIQEQE